MDVSVFYTDAVVEKMDKNVSWKYLSFPQIVQMNNYFGLGIDAELSLDFHLAREDEPDKFTSR